MPLWCRLRLTWSTFRFRSRDACMTKLGIMTDENTTSQQTQPTEAATEAAAETATDTDAQQQDQGAQSAAESAAPVDFEPLTATYERLRHSTDPAELSEFARRPLPDRADQAAFSRATALLEAVAGNPQGLLRQRRREGQAGAVHVRLHRRFRRQARAELRGAGQVPAVHRQGCWLRDSGRRHHSGRRVQGSLRRREPLTHEKLAPVQAVLKADNKEQAFEMCEKMLKLGAGHTAAIHTNNQELVREYGVRMHACRIIWNQPSSLGGIGDIYNAIAPSLTLGCGSYGGNSVSGNVQAVNLVNIKRIARRNNNMQWFKIPAKTYFEPNAIKYLRDMYGIEKAVIVCDKVMEQLGIVDKVIDQLRARSNRVTFRIIDYVEPEPSVETVEKGAEMMREEFEPDTIIAVGGGSPMDASKIMWLLYEHPEIAFSDVREKFFDIRKRAFKIPPLGKKAKLVCIPTSSGTGSEVTPFAVITDHKTGYKYPITDYALTPSVAIVDPVLARTQPRKLASDAGFDALTHSMEAYVSVYANDFTDGMALHAAKLIWDNLAESVNGEPGLAKTNAQEKMHNAATMAGMAFGSAFLGMCHGMAHTIGALCHIAHGRTNSILLPYVIRYNGQIPEEPTSWPKYNKYIAPERYQDIARNLGIDTGKTPAEAVENLAKAVEDYRDNKLGMNKSFQDCGVDEDYFWSVLDQIGMRAYEDQCTPANPRIPLINDMKDIAVGAYYGVSQAEGHKLRIEREGEAATEEASER